jgi:hypothetical protein
MKADKIAEAAIGAMMIGAGGVAFLPTTIPGAILIADAFNVKTK